MLHTLRFSLQNALYLIMLLFLVPVLFTFYIQGVLKFKCKHPVPKRSMHTRKGIFLIGAISLCLLFAFWRDSLQWAMASSFMRFLDHTQRRTTVGRTPLDE